MRGSLILMFILGCGVAPVQWSGPPREPPQYNYAGVHGAPRAYGGEVCAVASPHAHGYPPVPKAAFHVDERGYAVDTRIVYAYFDPHPHTEGTCFLEGWHMHQELPVDGVRFNRQRRAFSSSQP